MRTILLVEDETLIAMAEKRTIESFGYRAKLAATGEEAVKAAVSADSGVDLVLMDIDLGPGMDGPTAAREILDRRRMPIVFLSSHSERDRVEMVRGIARYGYVVKNAGNSVLESSIELAFELFDAEERLRAGEGRLSALVKGMPDLVWLKDEEGVYLACSAALERRLGLEEARIVGRTDYDLLGTEEADAARARDRAVVEGGSPRTDEEWISFAGSGRALLETTRTPMYDEAGRLVGVLAVGRDITERKRAEEELKERESRSRKVLEAVVEPGGDLGSLSLPDVVDLDALRPLLGGFSALTNMVVAILDLEGRVLVATGWREICTDFHRACPESAVACTESDLYLSERVRPGEYIEYKCENGMWDIVTPLIIEGRHLGNIYTGQYFYDDDVVDEAAFEAQAARYGFDAESYVAALRRVPRFPREAIARMMEFLVGFTGFVSRLSYGNLRLARTTAELRRTEELLSKSVREKETLLRELQHRVKNSLGIVSSLIALNGDRVRDEDSRRAFREASERISCVSMVYEKLSESASGDSVDLGRYLSDLTGLLRSTYAGEAGGLEVAASLDPMDCDPRQAVSLGLILNELFTNAIKYARRNGRSCRITVRLDDLGDEAVLSVSDDGPGFAPGFDPSGATGLGIRIAMLMAEQIGGSLTFSGSGEGGALATLAFAKRALPPRRD